MANKEIGLRRLANQRISGDKLQTAAEVVRWMGAMQAQDYNHALWAVGLRTNSATMTSIEQAIADREILRTWPMRGTIHFIPPEDAKWMLDLMASRMIATDTRRLEQLGLMVETIMQCQDLFIDALNGGKCLTRKEMLNILEEAGISTTGQRGYHILWYIAQSGVICMGPMQGKQQTFVLLDEWVPEQRSLSREEGLAELAGRYFTSHGPATDHDLARWAGITATDARLGIELAEAALTSEVIDGTDYWVGSDSVATWDKSHPNTYLLPGFDEFLLGYKDRDAVLAPEHAGKIVPGNNGIFKPMIVVDGQIVGTWQRNILKDVVNITLDPFTNIGDIETLFTNAAQAYGDFMKKTFISMMVNVRN
ncbi:MAG: winged helix DNA-binding domain-containing protein [Chloroflexi bacterium]|nr:winged helix DNA-binding domain-containing protein [Chloroflexota bacterium]